MIDVVNQKISALPGCPMAAICADLLAPGAISGLTLSSFDLVFSKLAFHHIADVKSMVAAVHPYLKPGGRLCVCDLESTANVRLFHHRDQTRGVEYEHDGFSESQARDWFNQEGWTGVEVARVPFSQSTSAGWIDAGHNSVQEFVMMLVSAVRLPPAAGDAKL